MKNYSRVEFLFMIGGFGSLISLIQCLSLELKSLDAVTSAAGGYWFGYTASMLISYSVVPIMLEQSSAVVMNVSFLTSGACSLPLKYIPLLFCLMHIFHLQECLSDFFSIIFAVALFQAKLVALYFVAFACIMIGMFVYNLAEDGYSLTDMWAMFITCSPKKKVEVFFIPFMYFLNCFMSKFCTCHCSKQI